jgi:PAS domain S-box-containing protein
LNRKEEFTMNENTSGVLNSTCKIELDKGGRDRSEPYLNDSLLFNLVSSLPLPMIITNKSDSVILAVNSPFCTIFGADVSTIIGEKAIQFYCDPNSRAKMVEEIAKYGRVRNYELLCKKKNGTPIKMMASIETVRYCGSDSLLCSFYDIVANDSGTEILLRSEELYKSVIDNISIGVALISPEMEVLALNNQMKTWNPHVVVDRRPICYKVFNSPPGIAVCEYCPTVKTLSDGLTHEEITSTPMGNEIKNYRIISSPIKNRKGQVIAAIEMVEDITKRLHSDNALKESELRLRAITEAANDAIIIMDDAGTVQFWNPAAQSIFGYSLEEIKGKELHKTICPVRFQEGFIKTKACFATSGRGNAIGKTLELIGVRKDASEFPVSLSLSSVKIAGSWFAVGILRDITEQKEFEAKLKENHEMLADTVNKYTTMINTVPAIMYIKDLEGKYTVINDAFSAFVGLPLDQIIGKNSDELFSPEIAAVLNANDELIISGKRQILISEEEIKDRNGESHYTTTTNVPLYDFDDSVMGIAGITQDVTEHRNSRQQLIQSDKLAAIGTLAAGVAHEINNPIGYVSSNLNTMSKYLKKLGEHLEKESPHDERDRIAEILIDFEDAINESIEGAGRVRKIVADLKSFSRIDRTERELADINEGIRSTLNIVWNELKYKCQVEQELSDLPDIYCIPNQLNQVFMNLLVNAGQAIDKAPGIINIKTWGDERNIYISIKDNGMGIKKENKEKVFEPFFTTKDVGKGTGLGLSLSYDIIKKHNGRIDINSEVGIGTEFIITLPLEGLSES